MNAYNGIICPHCGFETGVEPALILPDDPMIYCDECDEPLFKINTSND
jgi:hypothetical protein